MTRKFQKTAATVLALVTVLAAGTLTAVAATDSMRTEVSTTYGYLTGQQRNVDRHVQNEAVSSFTTDAEREAYFEAQGIGGDGPYSAAQHLDAEELVAAGVIDQATADKIAAYGSTKHDAIHARYEGKMPSTPDMKVNSKWYRISVRRCTRMLRPTAFTVTLSANS